MQGNVVTAGRKRAAVEMIAREGAELRRTARRYSLCAEDAEDAFQRALEIVLVKAPSDRPRELVRWTQTVVKHEALAVRRNRERLLGTPPRVGEESEANDPIARLPASDAGPDERLERQEQVARSREALRSLKPAEQRALTLLATGHSYAEIAAITGFSKTKVNRSLAEGRERFRHLLSRSEDGSRCAELAPLLSAFCDGEGRPEDAVTVREHLRACAACRATMRAYRAAPAAVAALAPALPASRSLLGRLQELFVGLQARLSGVGGTTDSGIPQVATAGGTRGAGTAALAKLLTICAGTVGGAACVATGVAPVPLDIAPQHAAEAKIERVSEQVIEAVAPPVAEYQPPAEAEPQQDAPQPQPEERAAEPESEPSSAEAGAIEYVAPPPAAEPAPTASPTPAPSSGAAGEFGP